MHAAAAAATSILFDYESELIESAELTLSFAGDVIRVNSPNDKSSLAIRSRARPIRFSFFSFFCHGGMQTTDCAAIVHKTSRSITTADNRLYSIRRPCTFARVRTRRLTGPYTRVVVFIARDYTDRHNVYVAYCKAAAAAAAARLITFRN